jgi:hypothetical protein
MRSEGGEEVDGIIMGVCIDEVRWVARAARIRPRLRSQCGDRFGERRCRWWWCWCHERVELQVDVSSDRHIMGLDSVDAQA